MATEACGPCEGLARLPSPVHGAGGASVGSCEVRRWVRHSVRCWSHATEGTQTRHVAGSQSQQGLLRASAVFTDASRSSCWWPRPQWRWVRRDVGHMVWGRARVVDALRRSIQATTCGPRERPETATEPPAALGGPAAPRAPPRHGRRCRKFLERGVRAPTDPDKVDEGNARDLLRRPKGSTTPLRRLLA